MTSPVADDARTNCVCALTPIVLAEMNTKKDKLNVVQADAHLFSEPKCTNQACLRYSESLIRIVVTVGAQLKRDRQHQKGQTATSACENHVCVISHPATCTRMFYDCVHTTPASS